MVRRLTEEREEQSLGSDILVGLLSNQLMQGSEHTKDYILLLKQLIKNKANSGIFDYPDDLDDEDFDTETVSDHVSDQLHAAWDKIIDANSILSDLYMYISKL